MTDRILVPYDGADPSRSALEYASARHPDSALTILHVIEPFPDHTRAGGHSGNRHAAVYERRRELLEEARQTVEAHGGPVTTAMIYGRPITVLTRYVATNDIDEIVMGSRGREGVSNLLLGSVSQSVIKRSPVPVTVVRASEDTSAPKSVLVPFDGSAQARDALRHALEHFPDAEITALFVFATASGRYVEIDSETNLETVMDRDADDGQAAENHVLGMAERVAERYGRDVATSSVRGDLVHEIDRWTSEHDVDHLVIGREASGRFVKLLGGDVTESIVRRTRVPVTVVP